MDEPKPWEQQPGETSRAFAAFVIYRDMGIGRSLDAAYKESVERGAKGCREGAIIRLPGRWKKWCGDHRWVERVQAYDAYLDRARSEAAIAEAQRVGREEYLEALNAFRQAVLVMGKGGIDSVLKLKKAINEIVSTPGFIQDRKALESLEVAARVVKSLQSESVQLWDMALGVSKLLDAQAESNN